jgi:hypothetical protein
VRWAQQVSVARRFARHFPHAAGSPGLWPVPLAPGQSERKGEVIARFLLWRLLGAAAAFIAVGMSLRLLNGMLGKVLRGSRSLKVAPRHVSPLHGGRIIGEWGSHLGWMMPLALSIGALLIMMSVVLIVRVRARARRHYVRLRVEAYRTDKAAAEAVVAMFESLHKRLLCRWWRRLLWGQPSLALEVHHDWGRASPVLAEPPLVEPMLAEPVLAAPELTELRSRAPAISMHAAPRMWLAVVCPVGAQAMVEAALRSAYPNCRLTPARTVIGTAPTVLRLKKHAAFIKRVKILDRFEHEREPAMNRLMTAMGACGQSAFVQMVLTPTPAFFEQRAKRLYKRHEDRLARERREGLVVHDRSMVEDSELRGGLDLQHRPLFFAEIRVVAGDREGCERIASELRASAAENHLVERGTTLRHGLLGLYGRRVRRGEGNPLPSPRKGVFASTELAALWHLPSIDYLTVPFARSAVAFAPAPPAILRPADGPGTLRDALGPVTIHPAMRRQNTAVPGAVEQGKSSYLVATVAEDLRRERCAVIVLDPKGDAAEAAVSLVPADRTCTLLDFAHPTCGFDPLAAWAPADVIADNVVAALKNLFTDADIRASSDRYLRNAIIAVLAHDRSSTLWDAARLLSVGEEGYSYRARVGARVRAMPEFKEISEFFTAELTAQLADARSTTTAKLDAPVNKLARLLNSPSIKRVLLNDSLRVDFDRLIAEREVLVVKGALGAMGAGNTSVLMQLLVGMLDAALGRQQDLVAPEERVAVALKVDEAPLVLNRGFAETMALKRSAGLETVACWQTESQWVEREIREQLDALFAHRVYFATASVRDARAAADLTMAEFSDMVRPGVGDLSSLGNPDVRLRLPKHHAIVSWSTPEGRQPPFVAQTIPLRVDHERLALHAARQERRGGRYRTDLTQPHWDRRDAGGGAPSEHRSPRAPMTRGAPPTGDDPPPGPGAPADPTKAVMLPETPAGSYRELIDLDGAHSVRWAKAPASRQALTAEAIDLEILALIASLRHVLTSQVHRRFNEARASTTTQRRLKRLSDGGLLERFQFHRRDGGGIPMCYVIAPAGLELLHAHGRAEGIGPQDIGVSDAPRPFVAMSASAASPIDRDRRLRQAIHDVHVCGWALAFERALGGRLQRLLGPSESVLSPPSRSTADGRRVTFGPGDLRLPEGRAPHEFLSTSATGARVEVERFETVRPDATIQVPGWAARGDPQGGRSTGSEGDGARSPRTAFDVLVELDDRLPEGTAAAKLERYDHLLAGWSVCTARYGRRAAAIPVIVFVCRDRARARECARGADRVLSACRAYAGEYPASWEYPGRGGVLFVSERDIHEGLLLAYRVPPLPPAVRAAVAGDARAREPQVERTSILPVSPPR